MVKFDSLSAEIVPHERLLTSIIRTLHFILLALKANKPWFTLDCYTFLMTWFKIQ